MSTSAALAIKGLRHAAVGSEESSRSKIERLVRKSKFDYDEATDSILEAMKSDEALREYVCLQGARYVARNITGNIRTNATMADEMAAPIHGRQDRASVEMEIVSRTFLDEYTLPGGGSIGDAMRADLKAAIEYYAGQEAGMRHSRKFCEAVGKKLPDGRKVREVFTDAQLKKIYRELT